MAMIFLNTIILASRWTGMPDVYDDIAEISNLAFGVIFLIEAILKLIAYGRRYFLDDWNRFDFSIVIASILGFILSLGIQSLERLGPLTTLVRSFRILRVFRLFRANENMNVIS